MSPTPRFPSRLLLIPAAAALLLPMSLKADTPLSMFRQDCHELSTGKQNNDSQTAKLIIRSWIKGLDSAALFNGQCGLPSSPLNSSFDQAGDPVWCAGSLEKFIQENSSDFPDNATAEQVLPLWWISIHPQAEGKHKEILRTSLQSMRERKNQSIPMRRFPVKTQ